MALVLLLIAVNGFYVAGEFALVAVNRNRVEALVAEGDKRAIGVLGRLRDLSFELSGAQLGITISSLIVGAIAEPTVARLLSPVLELIGIGSQAAALGIALVLATTFQMVMGELFPKNVAIARPYGTSILVGRPMGVVNRLLGPLIRFFNRSANWTVRRLGIEPRDELVGLRSMQELEMIVRASAAEGDLAASETSLLTRAIIFGEKDATDAMVPRVAVEGVPVDVDVSGLRRRSVETGHSRFPVFEHDMDTIVGIAYVKDTFAVPPEERDTTSVSTIMVAPKLVPESMHLDDLLVALQEASRTMAVVVDEYGGTAGIITIEDIVEEILGEIADEHDSDGPQHAGSWMSGSLHRREVEELTGFEWADGSYDTLNGFVTAELGRFPEPGDVVRSGGYRIEVLSVEDHVADRLTVEPLDEEPG